MNKRSVTFVHRPPLFIEALTSRESLKALFLKALVLLFPFTTISKIRVIKRSLLHPSLGWRKSLLQKWKLIALIQIKPRNTCQSSGMGLPSDNESRSFSSNATQFDQTSSQNKEKLLEYMLLKPLGNCAEDGKSCENSMKRNRVRAARPLSTKAEMSN